MSENPANFQPNTHLIIIRTIYSTTSSIYLLTRETEAKTKINQSPRHATPAFEASPLVQICQVNEHVEHVSVASNSPQSRYSLCFRCQRLRLTVLVYPWQEVQDELLQGMIDAGSVAVTIEVTGIDLMEKHFGKTPTEMQPILMKLIRFLCNIPGPLRGRRGMEFIVWAVHL